MRLPSGIILAAVVMGWLGASGLDAFAQTAVHVPTTGMTCAGDRLVWVNTRSGIYHFHGIM